MIIGRFDEYGRPFIRGRLFIPRLNVDSEIDFLLDTGADATCLHPVDLERIGIEADFVPAGSVIEPSGIGGRGRYFEETAVLFFEDETALRLYAINLYVAEPDEDLEHLPSVLGRDVINRWSMTYDPANDRLEFTIRSADATF